jgi:hypothetical protein
MLDKKDIAEMLKIDPVLKVSAPPSVPDAVVKFCDSIDRNFSTTADKLEITAVKLHGIADGLLERAKQLRDVAPKVSKDVHDWITYERESLVQEQFYRPLTEG